MTTALTSSLLSQIPKIRHGFGTLAEPVPDEFQNKWNETKVRWKQVHGNAICQILESGQICGDCDGLWTKRARVPAAVVTADCVPILLAKKDGTAVAALHAGWRGTKARISTALWKSLSAFGEIPTNWVAAIGPAVGPCCYEVSEELAEDFQKEFHQYSSKLFVPKHRQLDLPTLNELELRAAGLQVDVLRTCTKCSKTDQGDYLLHSYRREGGGTRQWSVIEIYPL